MPQISPTDPLQIRLFIFYEARLKTPIFEGFQNLSKVVGHENIDFPEYEFWYYRFLSGNFDLEDDRSSDKKPVEFRDLPFVVLDEIVENLNIKERLNLGEAIPELSRIIDQQKKNYTNFEISAEDDSVQIKLDSSEILEYSGHNFLEISRKSIQNILKSTTSINYLNVNATKRSESIFDRISGKIPAKNIAISVYSTEKGLKILELCEPGVLKEIELKSIEMGDINDNLFEMEQFKQAKYITMNDFGVVKNEKFDDFWNFKMFDITLSMIRAEDVLKIKDAMMLETTKVRNCVLRSAIDYDHNAIGRELGAEFDGHGYILRFLCPIDNFTYQITIDPTYVDLNYIFLF
ncbi:hypothetical protein B9Z55_026897 [Caenorhabditis nigoni]|uniref:F-box domain-containing protein n=1 Tax=Caenorhabditis nigoni TaxID=1611254 RepID=A0A2G5SHV3_9PELO|nr:hypothetical protein B9Z55_026897 [Caenorhabditis nigoni]